MAGFARDRAEQQVRDTHAAIEGADVVIEGSTGYQMRDGNMLYTIIYRVEFAGEPKLTHRRFAVFNEDSRLAGEFVGYTREDEDG